MKPAPRNAARKGGGKSQEPTNIRAVGPAPPRGRPAAEIRRRRTERLALNVAIWVLLPTLAAGVYYGFFASPQYESVTAFTVESADGKGAGLAGLIGGLTGSSSGPQTLVVRDYIRSREMLALLAEQQELVSHFRDPSIDWLSRLRADTKEEAFEYYLSQIELVHDSDSGVLTLRARAFDAETAQSMARAILQASERKVNSLSDQARRDAIGFAQQEVDRAQERVSQARQKLMAAQVEGGQLFNPVATAQGVQSIVTSLEGQLAEKRAKLRATQSVMGPGTLEARELRTLVASIEKEIRNQKARLVEEESVPTVARDIARFEPIAFEKEFAERALASALTSLEMARVDSARQHRYVAVLAAPSIPDAPTHPDTLLGILRVFVLSIVVAGLGGLAVASIREHAKV